jgi:hypothetical protein
MTQYTTRACPVCNKEFLVKSKNKNQTTCSVPCSSRYRARVYTTQPVSYHQETDTYHIPLTHGHVAIVDACDRDLADFYWTARIGRSGNKYAFRRGDTVKHMHRIVLERALGRKLLAGELVDHIDRDGLNNRRSNLRLATRSQNNANSRRRSDNASGFKGVMFYKPRGTWKAYINVDKRRINLGYYDTPELAHAAYIAAAHKHFGEFAHDGKEES